MMLLRRVIYQNTHFQRMFQDLKQCTWTELSCAIILINLHLSVLLVFICSFLSFKDFCLLVRVAPRAEFNSLDCSVSVMLCNN